MWRERPPGNEDLKCVQIGRGSESINVKSRYSTLGWDFAEYRGEATKGKRPWKVVNICTNPSVSQKIAKALLRRLYSSLLWCETTLCKTPHFQWIYGKLNQIYEKLRSDQMDPKSALGGPKPISRTGGSLLKNWSYTSNQCIYFSILLDWRSHLAKTLFVLHKYIKCALL